MASKTSGEFVEQQLSHPSKKKEQQLTKIPHFIIYLVLFLMIYFSIYIVLQWVLIIVLFINGLIAFIANEFARFFELRVPCFLCTRIDHTLLRRNLYYNDSICEDHRKEVSSMVFCHIHRRLSDIRLMCQGCLLSFANENSDDQSMVGGFDTNFESSTKDDCKGHLGLPHGQKGRSVKVEKSSIPRCSCCGEPQGVKISSLHGVLQKAVSNEGDFPPTPAPSPRGLVLKKNDESRSFDSMSHVQYSELNITSDTESEIPDEEYRSSALTLENQGKEDIKAATVPLLPYSEDLHEDSCKTPTFIRTNRYFGISSADSATASPRWPPRIPRRSPADKGDSGTESVEGNSASEADAETILHHLKRQVRLDRKTLIAMYMELDEERSSSAVAANQAMAMITRLQAEKAAIQMEALQYQRIMEEQAEYDQEALQVMRDLLHKREEEIKVLEAELKSYREGEVHDEGYKPLPEDDNYEDMCFELNLSTSQDCSPPSLNAEDDDVENEQNSVQIGPSQVENSDESLLDFEQERLYLMDQLKLLEKKIQSSCLNDGLHSMPSNLKDEDRGEGSTINISKAISHVYEKLMSLERDRDFIKHALLSLQEGDEGRLLLRDIAKHLRELRDTYNLSSEGFDK